MEKKNTLKKVLETTPIAGVFLSTFYDTRRVKEDLTFPVKYRITYNSQRNYYSSGVDLTEEEWTKLLKLDGRYGKNLSDKKELIDKGFSQLKTHIIELQKGEGFSFPALNKKLKKKSADSVNASFEARIEALMKEGRISTASSYRCTLRSIERFTAKKLKFTDVTVDWLKRYEKSLKAEGSTTTTIGIYMRTLRAIMNEGKEYYRPDQYPFGKDKFQIKKGTGRKLALTLPQIKSVMDHPMPTKEGEKYRDLWYFSFLCNGLNPKDLIRLQYKDIIKSNSKKEIQFYRSKTINTDTDQKPIRAALLPQMQTIIKKWGNPDKRPDSYIFGFRSADTTPIEERKIVQNVTRLINKRMKRIGKELNLGNITNYSNRHSFATILKNNNVSIAFISEALGHSDISTTSNYLASFDEEARSINAQILTGEI